MSQEDTASENSFQPPANAIAEPDAKADAKPDTKPEANTIDYNDIIENISSEMIVLLVKIHAMFNAYFI